MRKRPLCFMCLAFLIIKSMILLIFGGQSLVRVPASSIFYEMERSKEVVIQGQVYKKTNTSEIQILYLKNNSIYFQNNSFYESNMLIYDDTFEEIPIGKTICVRGKLNKFEKARNPGNFDQQLYYAKQNLFGFVWKEKTIEISGEACVIREWLYQFRQEWKTTLLKNMSERNGGVLSAILLSEKSEMDSDIKELYQKNGIGHVLAISGLHISFIGLGIYRLLRKMGIPYLGSGILAIALLSVYVWMIGFSVSVIRAYVMLFLRIGADITGRVYDMLTALMLAAAIIVIYQPLYLTDAAFYMSHGAILGILIVSPQIEKLVPCNHRWIKTSYASIAINVTLFPILLWFYYELSVYSVVINLLVIPLMSFVLGFGMIGSAAYFIWSPVGRILLKLCDLILCFFENLGEIGCKLPFSRIVLGKPDWWQVVIYYVLLAFLVLFLENYEKEKYLKRSRMYIFLTGMLLFLMFIKFPDGKLQVTMIDVGQGDCIFIKGPYGKKYLIDGGSSNVEHVGKYRIEPFLKSQGVGVLDYVFVSHGDSDHCNGILELIERQKFGIRIKNLVFPAHYQTDRELMELLQVSLENGTQVLVLDAGQTITEGKLQILCLHPQKEEERVEGNAGSMVLDFSFGNFDMLCTGDVEQEGEARLVHRLEKKSYDILKVAHHGSKNGTKEEFLQIVKPRIALISAGKNNLYGHPHKETIFRLKEYGSTIYQTAECGAILLETDGDFIDIFPGSI